MEHGITIGSEFDPGDYATLTPEKEPSKLNTIINELGISGFTSLLLTFIPLFIYAIKVDKARNLLSFINSGAHYTILYEWILSNRNEAENE